MSESVPKRMGRAFRERIREESETEEIYQQLIEMLRGALTAEKLVHGYCPNCKHNVKVPIADYNAAIKAGEFLANQGHGRPKETAPSVEPIIFKRTIVVNGEEREQKVR